MFFKRKNFYIYLILYFNLIIFQISYAKSINLHIRQDFTFTYPQKETTTRELTTLSLIYSRQVTDLFRYSIGLDLLINSEIFFKNAKAQLVPYILLYNDNEYYRLTIRSTSSSNYYNGAFDSYTIDQSATLKLKKTRTLISASKKYTNYILQDKTTTNYYIYGQQIFTKFLYQKLEGSYQRNYENKDLKSKNYYGKYIAQKSFNLGRLRNNLEYSLTYRKYKDYEYYSNLLSIEKITDEQETTTYTALYDGSYASYENIPANTKIKVEFLTNQTFNKIKIYTTLDPQVWQKIVISLYIDDQKYPISLSDYEFSQEGNYWVYTYDLPSEIKTDYFYLEFIISDPTFTSIPINELQVFYETTGKTNLESYENKLGFRNYISFGKLYIIHNIIGKYNTKYLNYELQEREKYLNQKISFTYANRYRPSISFEYTFSEINNTNSKSFYLDLKSYQNLYLDKKRKVKFTLKEERKYDNHKKSEDEIYSSLKYKKNFIDSQISFTYKNYYENETTYEKTYSFKSDNNILLTRYLGLNLGITQDYYDYILENKTESYTTVSSTLTFRIYPILSSSLTGKYTFQTKEYFYQAVVGYKPTDKVNLGFILSKDLFSIYLMWTPYITPYISANTNIKYTDNFETKEKKIDTIFNLNYKYSSGNIIKFGGGYSYEYLSSSQGTHIISFFVDTNF